MATLKYYSGVDFAKVSYFMLVCVIKLPYYTNSKYSLILLSFWGGGTLLIKELIISGGGGVAEDASDVAAAQEGEHEDYPCEVQP